MRVTRRRVLTAAGVTGLTTVLAGCSGDGNGEEGGDGGDGGDGDGGDDGTPTDNMETTSPTATATESATPPDAMETATPTTTTGGEPTTTTAADTGATVTVDMTASQFDPRNLEIDVGTTVEWVNQDSYGHTITAASDNWSLDVEVAGSATASHTFDTAGVYDVYCRFHGGADLSGMSMKIAVGDTTIQNPLGGGGDGDETTTQGGDGGDGDGGYY